MPKNGLNNLIVMCLGRPRRDKPDHPDRVPLQVVYTEKEDDSRTQKMNRYESARKRQNVAEESLLSPAPSASSLSNNSGAGINWHF